MNSKWEIETRSFFRTQLGLSPIEVKLLETIIVPGLATGKYSVYYKRFHIYQGKGKRRLIDAPTGKLKKIQRRLLSMFWYRVACSRSAHGFVKKRSPITNAEVHAEKLARQMKTHPHEVHKEDVKDFFHRIDFGRVWRAADLVIRARWKSVPPKIRSQISEIIAVICTKEKRLPMGSPCSPAISNIVMARFDKRMQAYCKRYNLVYTRYADDIVVSGRGAHSVAKKIKSELEFHRMTPHEKKTKTMRHHRRQQVTGIVVNSGEPTISRHQRRLIRAKIWHTRLHLENKELSRGESPLCKRLRPERVSTLVGWSSWIASVNQRSSHQWFREQLPELLRLHRVVGDEVE